MSFFGFLVSLVALVFTLIAFSGWLDWFILVFALLGITLSAMGVARGLMRPLGMLGITLGAIAIIMACFKLATGRGIL